MRNPRHVAPVYRGTLTDEKKKVRTEFGDELELPVVTLECIYQEPRLPDYPSVKEEQNAFYERESAFQEGVVELNGEFYYLREDQWYDAKFLVKQIIAKDAGDNVVRTRTAPDTIEGVTKRVVQGELRGVTSDPLYIVR